jgi:hypothetical protein
MLLHICELFGSNTGLEIGYPDQGFYDSHQTFHAGTIIVP